MSGGKETDVDLSRGVLWHEDFDIHFWAVMRASESGANAVAKDHEQTGLLRRIRAEQERARDAARAEEREKSNRLEIMLREAHDVMANAYAVVDPETKAAQAIVRILVDCDDQEGPCPALVRVAPEQGAQITEHGYLGSFQYGPFSERDSCRTLVNGEYCTQPRDRHAQRAEPTPEECDCPGLEGMHERDEFCAQPAPVKCKLCGKTFGEHSGIYWFCPGSDTCGWRWTPLEPAPLPAEPPTAPASEPERIVAAAIRQEGDRVCVCGHRKGSHNWYGRCCVKDCACGPGCIHDGFVERDDSPAPASSAAPPEKEWEAVDPHVRNWIVNTLLHPTATGLTRESEERQDAARKAINLLMKGTGYALSTEAALSAARALGVEGKEK